MTKEQQDLAWACLPKEVREKIKIAYTRYDGFEYSVGYNDALNSVFGQHNLTSNTEPEEMLMVERKYIQEMYADGVGTHYLLSLFGDKCLPDIPDYSNLANVGKDEQPEFKFEVGQKVKIILCTHPEYRNKVGIITSIDSCGNPYVKVDRLGTLFHAPYALELYTEHSNVSANETMDDTFEYRNLSKETANYDKSEDNQLNDNMEEKELNLLELLKSCEGEKIFLPDDGYVTIKSFDYDVLEVIDKDGRIYNLVGEETLCIRTTGFAYLYPTQESFEQNPLNAAKAWQEWKEARKPKRWRAEYGEMYFSLRNDFTVCDQYENNDSYNEFAWDNYNYFRTIEEAQQAAEVIKEALQKFHETIRKEENNGM